MTPTGPMLSTLQPGRSVTLLSSPRAGQKTEVVVAKPATIAVETIRQSTRRDPLAERNTNSDPWQRNLTAQARNALLAYSQWATPVDGTASTTLAGVDLYV